ncbi:uncharacterized protein LOC127229414 [Phodopus roborovskii]|uniref:uncharacterized protein LOC127229414 n=1 Tax=Phodopus roborovskii TaxID=109678 RepID=UPI0021E3A2CE|nr:uncharacterized protein LOC127229414 [Phodopus roborovskii]
MVKCGVTEGLGGQGITTQKSQEAEPLISLSLLLWEDSEHLSQQLQTISSQDQEPPGSPSLSDVGSEYLPFSHAHEQALATEELPQQGEVCPGHKPGWSPREGLILGELAPPSGFFPYYRSQEVHLSSNTHQDRWCLGTREGFPASGAQDGCCKVTARGTRPRSPGEQVPSLGSGLDLHPLISRANPRLLHWSALAGPDPLSGFSPSPACCLFWGGFVCDGQQNLHLSRDHALGVSGFVPYYRSPEERFHPSPVPSSSVLGSSRD